MTASQIGLEMVYGRSYENIEIVMSLRPEVKRTRRIMRSIVVDWASHFTLVVPLALTGPYDKIGIDLFFVLHFFVYYQRIYILYPLHTVNNITLFLKLLMLFVL